MAKRPQRRAHPLCDAMADARTVWRGLRALAKLPPEGVLVIALVCYVASRGDGGGR